MEGCTCLWLDVFHWKACKCSTPSYNYCPSHTLLLVLPNLEAVGPPTSWFIRQHVSLSEKRCMLEFHMPLSWCFHRKGMWTFNSCTWWASFPSHSLSIPPQQGPPKHLPKAHVGTIHVAHKKSSLVQVAHSFSMTLQWKGVPMCYILSSMSTTSLPLKPIPPELSPSPPNGGLCGH